MVECLTLGSRLHGGETRHWSPGEGGVCEGARGGRQGDPGPGVSGAAALESGEGWVSNFLPSLSVPLPLTLPPPFLFSFLPPSLPKRSCACPAPGLPLDPRTWR